MMTSISLSAKARTARWKYWYLYVRYADDYSQNGLYFCAVMRQLVTILLLSVYVLHVPVAGSLFSLALFSRTTQICCWDYWFAHRPYLGELVAVLNDDDAYWFYFRWIFPI